ncbi:MAG: methyltransferase type 11 [Parcubacteria group bacterium Gr01-1014_33]|nr:MAG: methyltransferase type 11 [Parcubacteria group bacterium Gr01-1014_33]
MLIDTFQSVLCCPLCSSGLTKGVHDFTCVNCKTEYSFFKEKLFLTRHETFLRHQEEVMQGLTNRIKAFLQRFPRIYYVLYLVLTPIAPFGFTAKKALGFIPKDSGLIVNIGSGTRRIRSDVLNVDILPLSHVDIIADAANLPFRDDSLDMVISEVTLEHLAEPQKAIQEMHRVLKPSGFIYVTAPFLYPFHESPNDYSRWTRNGFARELSCFRIIKIGIWSGPMTAFISFMKHFLAIMLSFGSRKVYFLLSYVFMVFLAPLKLLDPFFTIFAFSEDIASIFFFWGRKKSREIR